MEPLRPERDEVVARKGAKTKAANARPEKSRPVRSGGDGGGGKTTAVLLFLLLCVATGAGGWLLYQQKQEVSRLETELGAAQDWINQSKLSLARFEGQLTETDQELAQSGNKVGDKLAFLESEIRKLWGVSYDRNRKAIKSNEEQVASLQQTLSSAEEKVSGLVDRVDAQSEKLVTVSEELAGLNELEKTFANFRKEMTGKVNQMDTRISRQMQQQKLTLDEIRARMSALEREMAKQDSQAEIAKLEQELKDLQSVVDSIDAFRSQITSRLLQLESRVESRGGGSGQ